MDLGQPIEDFPEYAVDELGRVWNIRARRELRISRNPRGHAKVTLHRDGIPTTRSVAQLVARSFVWNDWDPEDFDTPIHLNHDFMDCRAVNLEWRPRWFAIKYHKQYWFENYRHSTTKIFDPTDGEVLHGWREVCEKHGVYWFDVLRSCEFNEDVFPRRLKFAYA